MASISASSVTGNVLYAMVRNVAEQVWNGSAFETFNAAHWATYVIPLTEDASSGYYVGTMPATIPAQTVTLLIYMALNGVSAAAGDDLLGTETKTWSGTGGGGGGDITSINGSAVAAQNLAKSSGTIIPGTAVAGTLTVAQMTTDLPSATDKQYVGRVIYFTSGPNNGQAAAISGYDGTTKLVTFYLPVASVPGAGDTFIIV